MSELLVDPSFAFSNEGVAWLEENQGMHHSGIVISAGFAKWLSSGLSALDPAVFVAEEDRDAFSDRRERVQFALVGARRFAYPEVASRLSREAGEILDAIHRNGDLVGEIWADEWAYLQSHSFMVAKLRSALNAFRDAGATIVELGEKAGTKLVFEVIPPKHRPTALTRGLVAKAAAKWIVVGGAQAGGATLGGALGGATGIPHGAWGGLILGRKGGRKLGFKFVLAIDP